MGNKITCGFCSDYSDMDLDKKESFLMQEQYKDNQVIMSSRSQKAKATLHEKANKIQINFRKLKSLKVLGKNYLEKLKTLAAKENFKISETTKKNFIGKIDNEIKDILTNKIGITSLEKTNIHYITHNFKNIPSDKILNDLKIFRIQLDPIVITNSNCQSNTNNNELYWGEWNLNYKKHGFGFLITAKSDFYLGTFKDNIMEGVGLLVINNQNLPKIDLNNDIGLDMNNKENKSNSSKNNNDKNSKYIDFIEKQKFLRNENNTDNTNNYNNCNNTSLIKTNLNNSLNSNSNPNSFNKARTDSLYQKETFYKTLEEKNLSEFSNNNSNNFNGYNNNNQKVKENQLKQKIETASLINFINISEQEKNYQSKMSDFSKKMVTFLRSPKNNNDKENKNKISNNENENKISNNETTQQYQTLTCDIYIGEFKRGAAEGYGRLFTRTGEWYIGYFKSNKKNGEGELHFSDGSFYIGNFKNNSIEGEGKYFFQNGSYFSGIFKDGKFCGKGKMAWNDGRKYNGLWENHMLSGQGTHMWANGNIFEGNYKLSAKSGKGTFYWDESEYYQGEFLNNKLNGKGLFNVRNYVLKGRWKFGKLSFVSDVQLKNRAFTCEEFSFNKKASDFDIKNGDSNKDDKSERFVESGRDVLNNNVGNY